VLRYSQAY